MRDIIRAGYIERWGRGVEKICESCKAIGADLPSYELRGNNLRIRFTALREAVLGDSKTPKRQRGALAGVLEGQVLEALRSNPKVTQVALAKELNIPYRSLQRQMEALKTAGKIERIGGKRYGYWRIRN